MGDENDVVVPLSGRELDPVAASLSPPSARVEAPASRTAFAHDSLSQPRDYINSALLQTSLTLYSKFAVAASSPSVVLYSKCR